MTINDVLPVILYILGSILLVVLIILGIKLIQTIDRANVLLDDLDKINFRDKKIFLNPTL